MILLVNTPWRSSIPCRYAPFFPALGSYLPRSPARAVQTDPHCFHSLYLCKATLFLCALAEPLPAWEFLSLAAEEAEGAQAPWEKAALGPAPSQPRGAEQELAGEEAAASSVCTGRQAWPGRGAAPAGTWGIHAGEHRPYLPRPPPGLPGPDPSPGADPGSIKSAVPWETGGGGGTPRGDVTPESPGHTLRMAQKEGGRVRRL